MRPTCNPSRSRRCPNYPKLQCLSDGSTEAHIRCAALSSTDPAAGGHNPLIPINGKNFEISGCDLYGSWSIFKSSGTYTAHVCGSESGGGQKPHTKCEPNATQRVDCGESNEWSCSVGFHGLVVRP